MGHGFVAGNLDPAFEAGRVRRCEGQDFGLSVGHFAGFDTRVKLACHPLATLKAFDIQQNPWHGSLKSSF